MATKDQSLRMPISLKGIDRRPSNSLSDGELLSLINMRQTGSALRPIQEKVRLTDPSPQFKVLFKHLISESAYAFWGISTTYIAYKLYVDDVATTENLTFQAITIVNGLPVFSNLGNACMISDMDLEKTFVMLYQPDTLDYRPFDKFLPDMPLVQFQRVALATDDEIKVVTLSASALDETVETAFKGTAQEQFARMVAKGYLVGKYLIRCAWELFDGSIVMQTTPFYIPISEIGGMWHGGANTWVNVKFTGYKLQYKINISAGDLTALKDQYKDIVKSFNIYITNHASLVELFKAVMTDNVYYSMTIPASNLISLTQNWISNEIFYFQLIKIGIDSLVVDTFADVSLTDTSTLSSGNVLPAGSLSIHRLFGKNLFSYNQRIFLGNIKNTLFKGTSLYGALSPGSSNVFGTTTYYIGMSFDLDAPDGTRRVFTGWHGINYYTSLLVDTVADADIFSSITIGKTGKTWTINAFAGFWVGINGGTGSGQERQIISNTATTLTVAAWDTTPDATSDFIIVQPDDFSFTLHDFIGYPDARAKQVDIWYNTQPDGSGTNYHLATIPLTQVFGMNFSFAIPASYLTLDAGWPSLTGPLSGYSELPINANDTYWDGDRVQATEFQNPFYFPAINSYRVEGFVLGMATNAVALSTGQFGQFPIFTFTTQGIWALDIGDGDILISRIRPLSGTICINGRSILGIDGGVIFMSNEGLMILSGVNPVSISDLIVGPSVSPLAGQVNYDHIVDDPNVYQPLPYLDGVTFQDYAILANIAFSIVTRNNGMVEKEIIVSNPAYTYSYVFNLISKTWHIITQSWDTFIHDFPKTYGTKLVSTVYWLDDLTLEQIDPATEIMVHVETRPVKFGEEQSFKKLIRSLIYGFVHSNSEKPFTFYLFGSTDGVNWYVQNASNLINPGEKAAIGRSSFSCRSYIFIFGGYVFDDSFIQGLICDIEKRYDNKLR